MLVSVLGTAYAGTTMLGLMLGNGTDAFDCGEAVALFRPYRRSHRRLRGMLGDAADRHAASPWGRIGPVAESAFHARVAEALGVAFVIDSSKNLAWWVDCQRFAAAHGLYTASIVIWKDPARLAHSFDKRGLSLDEARHRFLSYHRRLSATGIPIAAVPWRRLASRPATTLAALCDLIGIGYTPGRERFWEAPPALVGGNQGTRAQLGESAGAVRSPGSLPEAFSGRFESFDAATGFRAEAEQIVARLNAADVDLGEPARPGPPPSARRGAWYYRAKAVHAWRRVWPEAR